MRYNGKHIRAGQEKDENVVHMHCMLDNLGYKTQSEYINLLLLLKQYLKKIASKIRYAYIFCFINVVYICLSMFSPTVHSSQQCSVQLYICLKMFSPTVH
jgi:hypothetical protein